MGFSLRMGFEKIQTFLDLSDAWYIYTSFLVMAAEDGVVDDHVEPHQFHVL